MIVLNAGKAVLTGKSSIRVLPLSHRLCGPPQEIKYRTLMAKRPSFVTLRKGMLEKLPRAFGAKRLRVYSGDKHEHAAQSPKFGTLSKGDFRYVYQKPYFYGTGRRKKSVARVRLYPRTGNITINDRPIDDYFGLDTLKLIVRQPLNLTGTIGKYDVVAKVIGGGVSGQAGAIRHGLSRALLQADEELRLPLKKAGFLTRDPRMKERKKYGLKAARRAPQFSKR